ncbi:exodeoxyribonuclease VII large subunit [bacterium]|nr:exodeoxyribonuclease VII large subunit [bacterium]
MPEELEIKGFSVTTLTHKIKEMFDDNLFLQSVLVEGEISNFKRNTSGHLYFTLKDENAQIPVVMFKSAASTITFSPKDGDKVYIRGSVQVYEQGGKYQLYAYSMKEKGIGDLYQRYEALKKKLEDMGFFEKETKKPLPKFPKNIALLTSKTGAVIEDLKTIILKRSRFSNLTLYPTKVQGEDAKYSIIENIKKANDNPEIDVIILARGGGSIEDLWPFNEEEVAIAIHNSKKPIISAIGHETDFTIADFTADLRAATPSDAALIVVRDSIDLKNELDALTLRLNKTFYNDLKILNQRLSNILSLNVFKNPTRLLNDKKQLLDNLKDRLDLLSPKTKLQKEKESLDKNILLLNNSYNNLLNKLKHSHVLLNEKLALLNPLSVLDKGYSITYHNNESIKSIDSVQIGDKIETKLKEGIITSIVESKEK